MADSNKSFSIAFLQMNANLHVSFLTAPYDFCYMHPAVCHTAQCTSLNDIVTAVVGASGHSQRAESGSQGAAARPQAAV